MPSSQPAPRKISEKVPAVSLDGAIGDQIFEALQHDRYKGKIKEIIIEHTDSVTFMKKVQEYSDEQIDKRLFKNVKVVISVVLGWIVTVVLTYLATKAAK